MWTRVIVLVASLLWCGVARGEPRGWSGSVALPGGVALNFEVQLEKDSGTISIPAQGVKDVALADVSVGATIVFTLKNPNAAADAVWEFTPAADGATAKGVLKQMGREFPSVLRALAPGEKKRWDGSVELPGGMKLNFEVALGKDSGTISIPQQGVKDVALSGVAVGETITFALDNPKPEARAVWVLTPSADGATAKGVLKQMGKEFPSVLKALAPGEAGKGMHRPQEPKGPFPYKSEEVSFKVENGVEKGGHTLAGTVTIPEGKGPFPGVILVTGSGPQDRDEQLMGHKPFLVIADHLSRHGIVVLRYDDRGVGKSTGDFSKATTDDFADDALAAVTFLAGRPEVDAARVGVMGHSEGGLIAPMVAAGSGVPRFIVLLAGPGMPGADLLVLQGRLISEAAGMGKAEAARNAEASRGVLGMIRDGKPDAEIVAAVRRVLEVEVAEEAETKGKSEEERAKIVEEKMKEQIEQLANPWMRRFIQLDPLVALGKVRVPVLAINGEKDLQVPPKENLAGIAAALKAAGNTDVTVKELPGLNHLFQTCRTGSPAEYADIEETFAPAALDVVTEWIGRVGVKGK